MKIEIEIDNITTLLDGLNNAIIAYNNIYSCKYLGLNIPKAFEMVPEEKLKQRIDYLTEFYKELLKYE